MVFYKTFSGSSHKAGELHAIGISQTQDDIFAGEAKTAHYANGKRFVVLAERALEQGTEVSVYQPAHILTVLIMGQNIGSKTAQEAGRSRSAVHVLYWNSFKAVEL